MPTTEKSPDKMPTFGWHFVQLAFCPVGILSSWHFVWLAFCPVGILSAHRLHHLWMEVLDVVCAEFFVLVPLLLVTLK